MSWAQVSSALTKKEIQLSTNIPSIEVLPKIMVKLLVKIFFNMYFLELLEGLEHDKKVYRLVKIPGGL